jgi:hypothetical protein
LRKTGTNCQSYRPAAVASRNSGRCKAGQLAEAASSNAGCCKTGSFAETAKVAFRNRPKEKPNFARNAIGVDS